jgi:hypothetical protein
MVTTSEMCWRIFVHGFVGFFFGPVVVIVAMTLFWPDNLTYRNSGLVLLLSVLSGGFVGGWIGLLFVPYWSRETSIDEIDLLNPSWDSDLDT